MSTFITRLDLGDGPLRLAVKDLIDIEGVPTTCASRAIADHAVPAPAHASVVATALAQGARIVGKTNLHELGFGATGINEAFGTPVNPLDPALVPGGSSGGSAAAVGAGDADVAYGSDTAGSIRIPAACCGIVGLKTTFGRVPLDGVKALTTTLDSVGPMAADVDGVERCMQLIEPDFARGEPARRIGRFRHPLTAAHIDHAVDEALAATGIEVVPIELPLWQAAWEAGATLLLVESREVAGHLLEREGLSEEVRQRLAGADHVTKEQLDAARETRRAWVAELEEAFGQVDAIATPTIPVDIPRLDGDLALAELNLSLLTIPVNLGRVPALSLPVTDDRRTSLQLIGPRGSEERLVATGASIERARRG